MIYKLLKHDGRTIKATNPIELLQDIYDDADAIEGKARKRVIYGTTMERFFKALEEAEAEDKGYVRVYSDDGFVANGYTYPVMISYIQAMKYDDHTWLINVQRGDAKRPYGKGSLTVVR